MMQSYKSTAKIWHSWLFIIDFQLPLNIWGKNILVVYFIILLYKEFVLMNILFSCLPSDLILPGECCCRGWLWNQLPRVFYWEYRVSKDCERLSCYLITTYFNLISTAFFELSADTVYDQSRPIYLLITLFASVQFLSYIIHVQRMQDVRYILTNITAGIVDRTLWCHAKP